MTEPILIPTLKEETTPMHESNSIGNSLLDSSNFPSSNLVYEEKTEMVKGKSITSTIIKERKAPKWHKDIKEFKWLLHLRILKKKGYRLKFVYNNNGKSETRCSMKYFQLDSENQSFVPIKPEKVLISKYKEGEGFVHVADLGCEKDFLDPPAHIADKLWDIAMELG